MKNFNSISQKLDLVEVSNFKTSGSCRWSTNTPNYKTIKTKYIFPVFRALKRKNIKQMTYYKFFKINKKRCRLEL